MASQYFRLCDFYIAALALKLFFVIMLVHAVDATEFKVGGSTWSVPSDANSMAYNQWAEMHRFQIGDSLLFIYEHEKDSVLWVNKEDYDQCKTQSPLASFSDGNTSFKFNQSGPYYFISGTNGNCHKNEKMAVVVMADRSNNSASGSNNTSPAPPPSPTVSSSPANPPATAPVGEESPSPPSPPPSKNGASSMMMHLTVPFGFIFLGSSLFFA